MLKIHVLVISRVKTPQNLGSVRNKLMSLILSYLAIFIEKNSEPRSTTFNVLQNTYIHIVYCRSLYILYRHVLVRLINKNSKINMQIADVIYIYEQTYATTQYNRPRWQAYIYVQAYIDLLSHVFVWFISNSIVLMYCKLV